MPKLAESYQVKCSALHNLIDILSGVNCGRSLRSSGTGLLVVPRVRTETYGEVAFSVYSPRLWNSLPEELRSSKSAYGSLHGEGFLTKLCNTAYQWTGGQHFNQ
ncbi:hypothetical protein N1851_003075 [Merluccius polli]|uniref:Uncharacterized protein n=1 Tax=Merluccius polli TaxID=89951 RepID=A0AA47NAJ5_MERPO|nr:hypothetical protein N1851_003075 [Merluccius polli]